MRIIRADLLDLRLPLREPFIISGGAMTERHSLLVRLEDETGAHGWGECPAFELPFYSSETIESAAWLIGTVLIPRIVGHHFGSPAEVDDALRAGVRGNPFARAAVETAAWDLVAYAGRSSLGALVASAVGVTAAPSIPCGVALGIPADRSLDALRQQVSEALDVGYRRVKIKVMPGWDVEPIRAVQSTLAGTGIPLTVDANGAYAWPQDAPVLHAMDECGLLFIEQPLAPDELLAHAALSQALATPICVDETLTGVVAARQLLSLGGPSIWNIKVHRVGGLTEACRLWRLAREHQVQLWAGTMPESGIGSQAPLAMAALPGFELPSDLEPSSRWYGRNRDVIKLVMGRDGTMPVPGSSIARLLDRGRLDQATTLRQSFVS